MQPTLLEVFGLQFHAWPAFLAFVYLTATWMLLRRNSQLETPLNITPQASLWVFIGTLIGARAYWYIQYDSVWNAWQAILLWRGGMVFFGGLIGGVIAAGLYARIYRVPPGPAADLVFPIVPYGQAIVRVACFLNGCCWGRPAEVPWAVRFPAGSPPHIQHLNDGLLQPGATASLPIHPVQLYATAGLLLIFVLLQLYYPRRPKGVHGTVALLYFFLLGIHRFVIEIFRGDSARPLFDMTLSQWISLGLVAGSIALFLILRGTCWTGPLLQPRHPVDGAPDSVHS